MLKRFRSWFRGSTKQEDKTGNNNHIEKVQSLNKALRSDEQILWEGAPSPRHSWNDHDQMVSPGSTGTSPSSLIGRVFKMLVLAAFILILGSGGLLVLGTGVMSFFSERESLGVSIFLVSLGLTLTSGLLFLLQPLANYLDARQLRYVITTNRAMVLRLGPVRYNLWMKIPLYINFAILFSISAIGVLGLTFSQVYNIAAAEDGVGWWLLFVVVWLIVFIPVSIFLGSLGGVAGFGLWAIISEASKDKSKVFVRSFYHPDSLANKYPVIKRLRKDGTGDLVLGIDDWEDTTFSEGGGSVSLHRNEAGFLSINDVEEVAEYLGRLIYKQ